jgi:hypothetical protein
MVGLIPQCVKPLTCCIMGRWAVYPQHLEQGSPSGDDRKGRGVFAAC